MVCDHPVAHSRLDVIGFAAQLSQLFYDGHKEVGFIVAVLVLQHLGHSFQTGAGIHKAVFKRRKAAIRLSFILDENQVPQLYIAGAIGIDAADVLGIVSPITSAFTPVYMDLAAGATGTGLAHLPEVVFITMEADVCRVDIGLALPDVISLLVAVMHGGIELIFGKLPHFGEQFPSPGDGFLFVIICKRPIAQHLKEGVMIAVLAHFFEVVVFAAGADALLAVDDPREVPLS